MLRDARGVVIAGALTAFLGVGLGAMGAHALERYMDERGRELFDLAAHYHLIHALGVIAIGLAMRAFPASRLLRPAALALLAGMALFCGSLYLMGLGGPRWLGAITPLGGLAFLAGWLLLALGLRAAAD